MRDLDTETEKPLELSALSVRLEDRAVLEGVSLALRPGELGCLVGPSGCGKTTLLRTIAGFEQPAAGAVRVNGREVAGAWGGVAPEQRGVGMVFQDLALFPHLTVAENVAFGLRGQPARRVARRVDELLELVKLRPVRDSYPHQLSGGQQQRVALIRAMAPRPALLLLDEPFSSQDMERREQLVTEVRDILKKEGVAAVLVTHDQHEAFAFADTVGVMNEGRLLQWDCAFALYHRPATRFVASFIGQGVFLDAVVRAESVLETELGELSGELSQRLPPATRVVLLVRPDDVIHDETSPLRAEVVRRLFRGATYLYTLRLASGAEVLYLAPSHQVHPLGEKIGIRLDLEHLVIFPR